ncbi:uncharacterized protein [Ptychodera flava]|uniref:uncharacterized protein n=1 Tax=Ptychodera flava TaxID=63121 RepID=UPI003969C321
MPKKPAKKHETTKLSTSSDHSPEPKQTEMADTGDFCPHSQTENKDIQTAVGVDVTKNDIDISHRLPRRQSHNREESSPPPPPIIVRFVRRSTRNQLYYARKHLRGKTPHQLHLGNSTNNIYVNENLTTTAKAKNERRKQLNRKYIWTSNGKIFTRKDSSSEVIMIPSLKNINRIN